MKRVFDDLHYGSASLGGFSDFEAATRYLKGKDHELIREDDPDCFTFPKRWGIGGNVKARSNDLRDHNKTFLRADFERAAEAEYAPPPEAQRLATIAELRTARSNMVRHQLHHCGITDERILQAFREVERDDFIPDMVGRTAAYADKSFPVSGRRWNMEPRVLARMLQEAGIREDSMILDLACGTGYATALLSKLGGFVTGVDCIGPLALAARYNLEKGGCFNTQVLIRDPDEIAALGGHHDLVVISGGAVTRLPEGIQHLVKNGGKILAIIRENDSPFTPGKAKVFMKVHGQLSSYTLFDAQVPLMPDFAFERAFMEKFGAGT